MYDLNRVNKVEGTNTKYSYSTSTSTSTGATRGHSLLGSGHSQAGHSLGTAAQQQDRVLQLVRINLPYRRTTSGMCPLHQEVALP